MYRISFLKKIVFIFVVLVLILCKLSDTTIVSSNQYLANTPQVIMVNSGDSVWSIASKYVTKQDDIRDFVLAIKHINHLDNNAQIFPGQSLKIPMPAHTINVAQK